MSVIVTDELIQIVGKIDKNGRFKYYRNNKPVDLINIMKQIETKNQEEYIDFVENIISI